MSPRASRRTFVETPAASCSIHRRPPPCSVTTPTTKHQGRRVTHPEPRKEITAPAAAPAAFDAAALLATTLGSEAISVLAADPAALATAVTNAPPPAESTAAAPAPPKEPMGLSPPPSPTSVKSNRVEVRCRKVSLSKANGLFTIEILSKSRNRSTTRMQCHSHGFRLSQGCHSGRLRFHELLRQ